MTGQTRANMPLKGCKVMIKTNQNPIPASLVKAREEANKLAHLLGEEWPDGDEIKDSLYAVGMAIKRAMPAIRDLEGRSSSRNQQTICSGIG